MALVSATRSELVFLTENSTENSTATDLEMELGVEMEMGKVSVPGTGIRLVKWMVWASHSVSHSVNHSVSHSVNHSDWGNRSGNQRAQDCRMGKHLEMVNRLVSH